jgi:hypothetical protein
MGELPLDLALASVVTARLDVASRPALLAAVTRRPAAVLEVVGSDVAVPAPRAALDDAPAPVAP